MRTKRSIPKVRFWDELLILLGVKSPPNVSYEYEVSNLDIETGTEPRATGLRFLWS
jgi:hypothetical protein